MGRLTIDLTDEQHKHVKAVAALEGKTIRQFATERLFPDAAGGAPSEEDRAWEELKALLVKRVESAEKNGFSKRSILDVAEDGLRRSRAA